MSSVAWASICRKTTLICVCVCSLLFPSLILWLHYSAGCLHFAVISETTSFIMSPVDIIRINIM